MGKALNEIGSRQALRFALGQFQLASIRRTLLPPQLRGALLRAFGAAVGPGSVVHSVSFCNLYRAGFAGLRLGRDCFIGEECFFDLADRIEFGDQVTLAERVMLMTHRNVGYRDHPLQATYPAKSGPIRIGDGSFVGAGAIVLDGVRIGRHCVVAAGSVVIRDVPDGSVVAGVPARSIDRNEPNVPGTNQK